MKLFFGTALLACATILSAQSAEKTTGAIQKAGPDGRSSKSTDLPHSPTLCSTWMRLQQGSSTQMLRTEDGKSVPLMTPSLTLTPHSSKIIKGATVTVHGYGAIPGTQPLTEQFVPKGQKPAKREITRKLFITFKMVSSGFSTQLRLPGFSAVTSIDVHTITYFDGTTWTPDKKNSCSVKADPFLLVAAH